MSIFGYSPLLLMRNEAGEGEKEKKNAKRKKRTQKKDIKKNIIGKNLPD
ncbi:hypothetical protein SCIP_1322 [Scardovia inopinata JCM 12537]|nr:hypothetical protein SCIP_1322 [Scardovia inopinata JCM 12537]